VRDVDGGALSNVVNVVLRRVAQDESQQQQQQQQASERYKAVLLHVAIVQSRLYLLDLCLLCDEYNIFEHVFCPIRAFVLISVFVLFHFLLKIFIHHIW